jgi:hypothetical protein
MSSCGAGVSRVILTSQGTGFDLIFAEFSSRYELETKDIDIVQVAGTR